MKTVWEKFLLFIYSQHAMRENNVVENFSLFDKIKKLKLKLKPS